MSNYDNNNSGAIFKNDKRETENHPMYKGSLNVEGKEYWVSVWVNTSQKSGQKYMSLKLNPKEQVHQQGMQQAQNNFQQANNFQQPQTPQQAYVNSVQNDFDDNVPF
jgi:uncharacterized protein (DUF736 family)